MFGAGHVFEMIARLKFNESLKRKKKGYFTIAQEYRKTLSRKNLTYTACSEADLKEIRDTVRAYHRDIFIKRFMALGITVFILMMLITFWLLA
jgi:hypothetical protein